MNCQDNTVRTHRSTVLSASAGMPTDIFLGKIDKARVISELK